MKPKKSWHTDRSYKILDAFVAPEDKQIDLINEHVIKPAVADHFKQLLEDDIAKAHAFAKGTKPK